MPRIISKLNLIKKLSLKEKNQYIIQKINQGFSSEIKYYLSKELNETQLQKANFEQTLHQVLLARFLSFHGATISPIRIANKVIHAKLSGHDFTVEELSKLYYQIAVVYFETFSVNGIENLYTRYNSKIKKTNEFSLFLRLIYYQSQIISGKRKYTLTMEKKFKSIINLNSFSELINYSVNHFTLCNVIYAQNPDFNKALDQLEELTQIAPPSFEIDLLLLKKKLYINLNKDRKLIFNIEKNGKNLYHLIENLFLDKFYYNQKLDLADEVMLYCYPVFNEYSYLLGNRFYSKYFKLSSNFLLSLNFIQSFKDSSLSDYWLIDNKGISNFTNTFNIEKLNFLNLSSGNYINNSGNAIFLGEKKSIVLMCIISSGSFGTNDFFIAERIYCNENISQKTACERIQDLITNLKKMGFPLLRLNKKVYFNFNQNKNKIIVPKNFIFSGELEHIKLHSIPINKASISAKLGMSPRSSSYKIKEWKNAQLITLSKYKKGEYLINQKKSDEMIKLHYTMRML